jgi:arabinose-5-phosphate isomerase
MRRISLHTDKKVTPIPMISTDIAAAERTIQTEIHGLNDLINTIDESFSNAVQTIQDMKDADNGRLIVTGMGKSGHVGMKLAATFSSTGTPASFVHPGEASHGDLGMITNNDVVLALSNSGEAPELSDIIAYTKRFSIPLIAITSNSKSTLGANANICLRLPKSAEACPNGLAPTTSTTMTMAMGDALAVALIDRMGLTADQFKMFHPGGKLGKKLLPISELMDKGDQMPFVKPTDTMDQVLITMTEINKGCVIVSIDKKNAMGLITDGDLKRHMAPDLLGKTADIIMTGNPKTINENTLAVEAVEIMLHHYGQPITSLLVVNEHGDLTGLIRMQSLLAAGVV